jgi:metallo-beta-lactamase family protein
VLNIQATTQTCLLPHARVDLLGASRSVTGAMTRVELGNQAILVDAGIAQGDEARGWSLPAAAADVDAVVLTHGHQDHVGSLPELRVRGFHGPILGTAPTLEIARVVLLDGLRLERAGEEEVRAFEAWFRARARPIPYGVAGRHLPGLDGTLTFHEAGHILGSASVELRTKDTRVLVSGDLGRPNSPILRDYNTQWETDAPVDCVVMECTYGDCDHTHHAEDMEARLAAVVNRALADKGHILVPAFAIGRTQTLLYHLNKLLEGGRIPRIPVAVDTPMGLAVTDTYQQFRSLFDREALDQLARGDNPLDFSTLYAVNKARDSVRLRDVKEPMVIIAGAGMCTGGRIVGHLQELMPRPETCVLFVGFQAPGTPGRRIQDAARTRGTVTLDGMLVRVACQVETLSGLSAHADRGELLAWLRAVPAPRNVLLHHGEEDAQNAFVKYAAGKGL